MGGFNEMEKKELIDKYIEQCDTVIDNKNAHRLVDDIIAVFHAEIPDIVLNLDLGRITYENINNQDKIYINDIRRLKLKLENYRVNVEMEEEKEKRKLEELKIQKTILTINNTNTLNVEVNFEQARAKVNNLTNMQQSEIDEILEKINQLEKIIKSTDKKEKKWENSKNIMKWIADKGVDVGIALLPLLLQINY